VFGREESIDLKQLQSSQFEIDHPRKIVTRFFSKKYKFDAALPLKTVSSMLLRDNMYMLHFNLTNTTVNHLFLDRVTFHCLESKRFEVVDCSLDQNTGKSVFANTVDMLPGDTRSFLFLIKPRDESIKLNKYETINLGQLELKWLNYFGDPGVMKVGPF